MNSPKKNAKVKQNSSCEVKKPSHKKDKMPSKNA